jgi:tetratricopeptide (TPR) repeat protein
VAEEQDMRATSWRLGVLLLLAAPVTEASGQPVPAPADRAAAPTLAEQKFLAKAKLLSAEGSRAYQRADLRRAMLLFQEALENCRKAYPREKHPEGQPDLAAIVNNLGFLHWSAREYGRAEPLFREALAMKRALYPRARHPDGHPDLASSLNSLGLLH